MTCYVGAEFSIFLSDQGIVYSFGLNNNGQLGLSKNKLTISIPSKIKHLPIIQTISCGYNFTICVDTEGSIWSFGKNDLGQLGTRNTTNCHTPQKIENIPPIHSISCGALHTLLITNDSHLWSFGYNEYGQLILGNNNNFVESIPQKTQYSDIEKISAGSYFSFFQNFDKEIFGCGDNRNGNVGLGHNNSPQIEPQILLNQPPNIIQFSSGSFHCLFLDCEGIVFGVGFNLFGNLGLGDNSCRNQLVEIQNIPKITSVFCSTNSSYLLDEDGNVWSFGHNEYGQLGHGDKFDRKVPTKSLLTNIQQLSAGSHGYHCFGKNFQDSIFAVGKNHSGELGIKDKKMKTTFTPIKLKSKYNSIWGSPTVKQNAKSARK